MKTFISFLTAAFIVGLVFFAIFYWIVGKNFSEAIGIASSAALGGFIVDYVRERRKNRINNRNKIQA